MMFHKLLVEGNNFQISKSKPFKPLFSISEFTKSVFDFAYGMTFESTGKHRSYRSGGTFNRKNGELFVNTFQGKICEFGIYKFLKNSGMDLISPELEMWGEGKWDDVDLVVNTKAINIKSASYFSNLLLLETKDWNEKGEYIPNIGIKKTTYDFFVLSRLKPNLKNILSTKRLLYLDHIDKNHLFELIENQNWEFDIPGYINTSDLIEIIKSKHILPQNSILNLYTKVDTDNLYCQSGDMRDINSLPQLLKNSNE
jgi:hypothetical protein